MTGTPPPAILAARRDVATSQAKLRATVVELRHRLDPRVVATEARDKVVARAQQAAATSVEAARARPWVAGTGAALIGVVIAMFVRRSWREDAGSDEAFTPQQPTPTLERSAPRSGDK